MSDNDARRAIDSLDHESGYGRVAVRHIVKLFENRRHWDLARTFFTDTARALAESMRDDRDRSSRRQRDFHGEAELARAVARFALGATTEIARAVCAPLADLVDHSPREAAKFVEELIGGADGAADDQFWTLWQDFADRITTASWLPRLDRDRAFESELIDKIFLTTYWKEGINHWPRLDGEAHRVHALAARLPAAPATAEAYARFLFTVGQQSLPDAFVHLVAVIEKGDAVRLVSTSNVAYYLEVLLGKFVYAQPHRLKKDLPLRQSLLRLLDALVNSGSSSAYRMRDDFVTPAHPE